MPTAAPTITPFPGVTAKTVLALLRNHFHHKSKFKRQPVLALHIIGSVAKGTDHADSDLDIAVTIPAKRGKDSLHFTEYYHNGFTHGHQYPVLAGRRVDFQFFYPEDTELAGYTKIAIN